MAELDGLVLRRLPLETVVPGQADKRLFYRVAWRQSAGPVLDRGTDRAASWIILADANGVGAALAGRLEALGHHCHLVYRADAFAQPGPRTWTANERDAEDFRRLLTQFAATEALPCAGVVYLWGLDAPPIEGLTYAKLKSASEMMCRGALGILHALAETRSKHPAGRRLWFVTANTQSPEGPARHVDPVQAPLWGLGRTIAIEYPGLWGGLIDLQPGDDGLLDIDRLAAELLHPDGETQIALSARGQRHVPRLTGQSLAELPARPPTIRADATYLVTGGLGMLGHRVARWLISKGAKHLVLTGRNASPDAAKELFSPAEANGADIRVIAADISRDEDVRRLIETISKELPPLRGVVHSAGVLDDGILAQLDWDRFARLFEPKVYGSWLLHEHTRSLALDFFILKSSLLSLLGSAGQGNYTASGTFLDSLATHRRAAGLPAMAINWCAWSEGGLATVSGARGEAMLSSLGMKFVSPDRAMRLFDQMMHRDVDDVAVADADWPTFAGKIGRPRFLAELVNTAVEPQRPARVAVAPAASHKANGKPREQLSRRLQQQIKDALGFVEDIDPDLPLNEIGLDSLMSVSLSNSLEREFGIPIPVAQLISGPTINQLIAGTFAEWDESSSPERSEPADAARAAAPVAPEGVPIVWLPSKSDRASQVRPQELDAAATQMVRRSPPSSDTSITIPATPLPKRNGGTHAGPATQSILQRHIMAELGFEQPLDPDRPLNEVGLDSLRAVKLSITLEEEFGIPILVPELIRGPTINELADHVNEALAAAAPNGAAGTEHDTTSAPRVDSLPAHAVPIAATEAWAAADERGVAHPPGADVAVKTARHHGEPELHSLAVRRAHDAAPDIYRNGSDPGIREPVGMNGGAAGRNGTRGRFRGPELTRQRQSRVPIRRKVVDRAAPQSECQGAPVLFPLCGRRPRLVPGAGRGRSAATWSWWRSRLPDAEPGSTKRRSATSTPSSGS